MANWKKVIVSGSDASLKTLALDTALPVAQGGTGATTFTDGGILFGNGSGAIQASAVLTNGQLLIGDGTTEPAVATLTNTANETSITNGGGSITIGLADDVTIPASLTVTTDLTVQGGDITLTAAATDIDLIDNDTSALSFDASGKAGILNISSEDSKEKVTLSGALEVTGTGSFAGVTTFKGNMVSTGTTFSGSTAITANQYEVGAASDTTITRASAGDINVEGNLVYRADGTDVPVADGGTGASSLTDGGILLGSGTSAITAMAVLGDGEMIVGDGSGDPVAESGATLRTSIGVGTGDSPTFTGLTLTGDLTVNGTTTTIASQQTTVSESLLFLATGSAASNKDAGIVVQSGSLDMSGSALYHDINTERWSVAKGVALSDNAVTPLQSVVTVKLGTDDITSTTVGDYGPGEMYIDTNEDDGAGAGTIYILVSE